MVVFDQDVVLRGAALDDPHSDRVEGAELVLGDLKPAWVDLVGVDSVTFNCGELVVLYADVQLFDRPLPLAHTFYLDAGVAVREEVVLDDDALPVRLAHVHHCPRGQFLGCVAEGVGFSLSQKRLPPSCRSASSWQTRSFS